MCLKTRDGLEFLLMPESWRYHKGLETTLNNFIIIIFTGVIASANLEELIHNLGGVPGDFLRFYDL